MTRRTLVGTALVVALLVASGMALQATPGFWQAATQADFLRGEVDQISIDENGRLMLGPSVTRVHDAGVPFIWTAIPGPDGSTYLGTGNDGKVIRVDRAGNGTVFYDSTEMEVHALASAPGGGIYVATSPDGRIYKVDSRGQATTFFDPVDKYIWALVVDRQGVVYAATGDKGVVYRITPDGKGETFFSTKALHAVALAFDAHNQLLVGTGSPGRVFRVDSAGKGFLLLDTSYSEVHAIRVNAQNVIYAAAQTSRASDASGDDRADTTPPMPVAPSIPNVSTEITAFAVIEGPVGQASSGGAAGSGPSRAGPTGAIFRIQPEGLWDELWVSRDDAPYDVALEADGSVLVATGAKGKLFRISGDPVRTVLLARVSARQATAIVRNGDRIYVATANPGLLMAVSTTRAARGTYESEVKDARLVSTWGVISWRAATPTGTRVDVQTRSGNTRTPDEAWSDWTGAYAVAAGSPITSPTARYLQWRAVLAGQSDSPILTSVSSAYLPRNVRPQVSSITVHPPGVVFQRPFSSGDTEIAGLDDDSQDRRALPASPAGNLGSGLGRRVYQKGLQTFVWKAEDDNGDELVYDVFYRREGETSWHPLKTGLRDALLVWDTTAVPDGTYVLRVLASDARSNPPASALGGDLESSSFDIDNVAPVVTMGAIRREGTTFVVSTDIRDADSPITRVEYSLDAQRWQSAFPRDGILDGRQESFELRLEAAALGRTLVVRAIDALGNVGTGQLLIRDPAR